MAHDQTGARRVVVITGASGGIGRAVTDRLVREGYGVVLVDKVSYDEVERDGVVSLKGDIRSDDFLEEALDRADQLGRLHGLVLLAGIREYRALLEMDADIVSTHFEINALAPITWIIAFAKRLVSRGLPGAIVAATSIMAHRTVPNNASYAASKSALRALCNSAAVDLSKYAIRVNCLAPGPTNTQMLMELVLDQETKLNLEERIPLGRIAEADEMTGAVSFLLSDDSSYVTGSTIVVDGGYLVV